MAWVKIKNSITNQILTMPEKVFADICKNTNVYVKVEEPKAEEKKKPAKIKEEEEDVQSIQLINKNEDNPSRKDSKKVKL